MMWVVLMKVVIVARSKELAERCGENLDWRLFYLIPT
jgi:hypothetical protein